MRDVDGNRHAFYRGKMKQKGLRSGFSVLLTFVIAMGMAVGVYFAIHSSLFYLKVVEVQPWSEGYPLTQESILEQANIPLGKVSLFSVDLKPAEKRLMQLPWVKGVVISKQFPSTVVLKIVEREPVCLVNDEKGRVLYLEKDGSNFEDRSMVYPNPLPLIRGFSLDDQAGLKRVTQFIQTWFSMEVIPEMVLSSLSYDPKNGLRAMVTYPMKQNTVMRAVLELGMNLEEASAIPKVRLARVLKELVARSLPASRIWLGDGKKIVVKISRSQ